MLNKLQQKVKQIADATQKITVDILPDEHKAPEHIREERWKICQECPKLYVPTSTCKLCGCFMVLKTWLPYQKCPIDKWGKYEPDK